MSDSVGQYLNEIGAVPLLTIQEEVELAQIIEEGALAMEQRELGLWLGSAVVDAELEITTGLNPEEIDPEKVSIIYLDEEEPSLDEEEMSEQEYPAPQKLHTKRELDKRIRARDAAKNRFIRANLRLVVSVARRYPLPPGMELLDLIQEGNLGLEHAVDKFDWKKGFKFSTYATFWIRQAIGRALDIKASLVRLPGDRSASLRAALREVSGDGDELDDEHARLHRLTTPTSLDRLIGDDDSNELINLLPSALPGPEQIVGAQADEDAVVGLLDILDERAKYAVEQRFGLGDGRKRSYREVGEGLGVTSEAARRLVKRALDSVRDHAAHISFDPTAA